jgi:hypothetical protein
VSYTPTEWQAVEPYAEKAAVQAQKYPDKRDLFLCHAWNDREGSAKELYGHLKTSGATVWFSELLRDGHRSGEGLPQRARPPSC